MREGALPLCSWKTWCSQAQVYQQGQRQNTQNQLVQVTLQEHT